MFPKTDIQSYDDEAKAGPWSISTTSFEPSRLLDKLATDDDPELSRLILDDTSIFKTGPLTSLSTISELGNALHPMWQA